MEEECLEFRKQPDLYPINCEQALEVGFLSITGTQPFVANEDALNCVSKSNNKFGGPFEEQDGMDDVFKVSYSFEKPIYLTGYMIKTANDNPDRDPRDWVISCVNLDGGDVIMAHCIGGEQPRDRFEQKTYRCEKPVWTTGVSLDVYTTLGIIKEC